MKLGTFALVIFDRDYTATSLISLNVLLTYLSPHRREETTGIHQRCIFVREVGEKKRKRKKKQKNWKREKTYASCVQLLALRCFVSRWIEVGVHKIREQTRKTSGKRGRGFDDLLLGHTESWNTGGWVAGRENIEWRSGFGANARNSWNLRSDVR